MFTKKPKSNSFFLMQISCYLCGNWKAPSGELLELCLKFKGHCSVCSGVLVCFLTGLCESSLLSWKAEAMLFWTALIQACCCRSESACNKQHLNTHTFILLFLSWKKYYIQTSPFWVGLISIHAFTHFDGETTSKQNRLSFSLLGLTVQRRKSSTTTVGCSWETETITNVAPGTCVFTLVPLSCTI